MSTPSPLRFPFSYLRAAAFAATLLALALPAGADVGIWTPAGPIGGTISVLATSDFDPNRFYAGTPRSGVFRTEDAAALWTPASAGLVDGDGAFPPVESLEIDPGQPDVVYAGTSGAGAYRTADGGRSWTRCGGLPPAGLAARVSALRVDPTASSVVFAATPQGVLRSGDGCKTWALRRTGLPAFPVSALDFDPAGGFLYVGLQGGGVYRSANRGGRWEKANAGLPPLVRSLGFDPRSPTVIFAGTGGGLYRSVDRGRTWSRVGAAVIPFPVLAVGFQPRTDIPYAATPQRVFTSDDRGVTWRPVPGTPAVTPLTSFAIAPDWLLAGTNEDRRGGGVFRSNDGGAVWPSWTFGISTLRPVDLAFHPTDPNQLFLSAGPVGVMTLTSVRWVWHHYPLDANNSQMTIDAIEMHPGLPGVLFAGSGTIGALLRSDGPDGYWRGTLPPANTFMSVLESDPRSPGALWTGGPWTAQYTPDGGATWQRVTLAANLAPQIFDIEVEPSDPRIVTYAGASLQGAHPPRPVPLLYRSTDAGATWRAIPTLGLSGSTVFRFTADRDDPTIFYATTEAGLFRTPDQGASWQPLLDFPDRPGDILATPGAIYASRGPSVLRSTNRGESWTQLRTGLGARPVERLWLDPFNPRHLYAGTFNAGLWEYTLPPAP